MGSSSKRLVGTVNVVDDAGETHAFGPDDTVPAWAQEKITNPAAWEADADESKLESGVGSVADPGSSPASPEDDGDPSKGTVAEVLERVGDDPDAAAAALEAEQAKGDKARTSLVEKLEALVAGDSGDGGDNPPQQ